jgi:aminopeptidase N
VLATPKAVRQSGALASRASDAIHYFSTLVGEMPYSSFTLAALDENIPGGHSPAYLTLLRVRLPTSPYAWSSDPVVFSNVSSFLIAHEVAHQWWGQAVGWKNYHEQWLSEGLAQYFAVLYAGSVQGPSTAHDILASMRSSVLDQAGAGPIYLGNRLGRLTDDPSTFRVILYNKSAVVLDMLRRLIGDKAFFDGLKAFYREHRFGTAGTDDLARAFQAGTDVPVSRFFDTWVLNSGIPEAKFRADIDPGGQAATVRVEPVNFPADYPLTVTIQYLDGSSEDVTIPVVGGSVTRQLSLKAPARRLVSKDNITLVRVR